MRPLLEVPTEIRLQIFRLVTEDLDCPEFGLILAHLPLPSHFASSRLGLVFVSTYVLIWHKALDLCTPLSSLYLAQTTDDSDAVFANHPSRDGQKRPVFIYRLLTAGAIDGKLPSLQIMSV